VEMKILTNNEVFSIDNKLSIITCDHDDKKGANEKDFTWSAIVVPIGLRCFCYYGLEQLQFILTNERFF
jgi:hypothetical protein